MIFDKKCFCIVLLLSTLFNSLKAAEEPSSQPPASRSQIPPSFLELFKKEILQNHIKESPDDSTDAQQIDIRTINPEIHFGGQIVPSLQQRNEQGEITHDCGYFALYNAISFGNPRAFPQLNRVRFIKFLTQALDAMSSYPELQTFENLEERELRHIVNVLGLPIVILTVQHLLFIAQHQQTIEAALEENNSESFSKRQLLDFLNRRTNKLVMVVSIANMGHWVAILAERKDNEVTFTIADSMTQCSEAKLSNPKTRPTISNLLKSLLPYHIALSNNISAWKNVLTEEVCNPPHEKSSPTTSCQNEATASNEPMIADMLEEFLRQSKEQDKLSHQSRQRQVSETTQHEIPGEGFDKVSISPELAAVCLANFPEIAKLSEKISKRQYPVRALFSGPPNIGKTTLARAIARHHNLRRAFYDCTAGTKFYKTHEEYWDKEIQPLINSGEPCVIILDEIDQLKPVNDGANPALHIKQAIADCADKPQISFIATTNKSDEIDPILKSRFEENHRYTLNPPNIQAQINILKYCFAHEAPQIANVCSDNDLVKALEYLDTQTVEDVLNVARTAKEQIQEPNQGITKEMVKVACIAVRPAPAKLIKFLNKMASDASWFCQKYYKPVAVVGGVAGTLTLIVNNPLLDYLLKKMITSYKYLEKLQEQLNSENLKQIRAQLARVNKYNNSNWLMRRGYDVKNNAVKAIGLGCTVASTLATIYQALPPEKKKSVMTKLVNVINFLRGIVHR